MTQSYHDINHSAVQKRSKSTINILHQEGDFDEGVEEECVDPMIIRSNTKINDDDSESKRFGRGGTNTMEGGET